METKVLQPAHKMTTAQCVIECSGYLRTIASQEFEGEDWQTAPKLRRQNLLTDFLCNLELSGEEFAELCGLIGFQLSKTTTAKLAKFTVIAYDWQSEANGEATADILSALDKCEGVALIEERGYHPQARTYDYLRFHIAAFWRCLVNELRSLCLGVGLVVYPKEIPATPTETPQISTEAAETATVSAEGENAVKTQEIGRKPDGREAVCRFAPAWAAKKTLKYGYKLYCFNLYPNGEFSISVENRNGCRILTKDEFRKLCSQPPQSPEAPQTVECATDAPKPRENAA